MNNVVHFSPDTHTYTDGDGVIVPSVTQLLRAVGIGGDYPDLPKVQRLMRNKAELSTRVHLATRFLDEDDLNWDTVIPLAVPFVKAWERFCKEEKFIPAIEHSEKPMIGEFEGIRFGMTLDRAGMHGKRKAVVDIKCTLNTELSWGAQLAGYVVGLTSEIGGQADDWQRLCVQLMPDGNYKLHEYTEQRDYATFASALIVHHFKETFSPRGSGKTIRTSMYSEPVTIYQPAMESA
jgi:hypothetical protein